MFEFIILSYVIIGAFISYINLSESPKNYGVITGCLLLMGGLMLWPLVVLEKFFLIESVDRTKQLDKALKQELAKNEKTKQ